MNYYTLTIILFCVGLFFGMLIVYRIAYWLGCQRSQRDEPTADVSSAVNGAVFALLGLLIAFTFSEAFSRFDMRRQIMVNEANAIGTAYLRLDLLPSDAQPSIREKLRVYADSRARLFEKLTDLPSAREEQAKAQRLQTQIWSESVAASRAPEYQSARMLLLPALNEMIDLVATRTVAILSHPPKLIFIALAVLALACSGLIGSKCGTTRQPGFFYILSFAAVISLILYLILDLEYPRIGLIRLDQANKILLETRNSMQ